MERIESKGLTWTAALIITALITFTGILLAKGLVSAGGGAAGETTLLPCNAWQGVKPLGEGVIYSDGTHLHALNSSGRQKWNYMVGAGFSFEAGPDGVAAWTGSTIALLDGA